MSVGSKELVDNLIVGNFKSFSSHTIRLLEIIERNEEVMLNDVALNDPDQLAVAIFNYPLIKDDFYKEYAEAAKRISTAKYAYYKKSAIFKENFTKLCTETFNKHHQSDIALSHTEQIQKVRSALKVVKLIGELYLADFFLNCNIAHFLEVLSRNIDSKVSDDCLEYLISIVATRVKNEFKLYKHNVHTSAINSLIEKYENETSKLKKNYKDLEIIEAVNKTIKSKSLKGINSRYNKDSSKNETIRQTRKIFETILSGSIHLSSCVQTAYDVCILYPDSFENEMLQLCADYIKKSFESSDDSVKVKCLDVAKFIGMLYNSEALTSDGVKGTISFLNKFDLVFSEPLVSVIFNEIYDKVIELEDEILKQVIPDNFKKISNGSVTKKEPEINDDDETNISGNNKKEQEDETQMPTTSTASTSPDLTPPKRLSIADSTSLCIISTSNMVNNSNEPIEKFKDLLIKLSPTNVAYILRETSQIRFTTGEDTIKELAILLVEHSVYKSSIIKFIVQVSVKLPETIVPHFSVSLMKKHLKGVISSKIAGCSEKESVAYSQFIKELYAANYYDRFDVIIVLETFIESFNYDRTALTSLLHFIDEFKDILIGKKLSKNMKQKLVNISQKLSIKLAEETDEEVKENIGNAIKILNAEVKVQQNESIGKKDNNYRYNGETSYRTENYSHSGNSSPIQLPPMHIPPPKMFIPPPIIDNIIQNALSEKMSPSYTPSISSSNSSPIHEMYKKDTIIKEKQQMNFKTDLYTRSDDDLSNRQSGSPSSVSYSLHENEIESEDFYDTASDINVESPSSDVKNDIETESAYSSLLSNDIMYKEENFKLIIRHRFLMNSEAVENFSVTFIKRGMKCPNSGFINLIDVIRVALKENEKVFVDFIAKLDQKFFEFIQNLPKSDENLTKSEKRKSLQLILMIGEFFNMGYMKNQTFISCLEKLLNDIGSEHQITLFHQLIKISMDKIIQNGITNVCKTFLDVLAKRVPSIVDTKDRNLISWELFVTLKILLFRYQKAQLQCPVTFFKMFLSNLNEDTLVAKLEDVKYQYAYKKDQLVEIVEFFLLTAISSFQAPIYVKLAEELQGIRAIDCDDFTFKTHMEFKLHDVIKNFLTDISCEFKMIEVFKITSFVGDLFIGNVASIYLVLCVLEMLLEREIESKKLVDCIRVLLQKVGYKTDMESVRILDRFFLFFNQVIKFDKGYRKVIYKELIELREKKWHRTDKERNMEQIEEYFGKLTNVNFIQISFLICGIMSKSLELMEMFLKSLWKFILINPESVLLYAKLTSSILNYNPGFKKCLLSFMRQRNETFKMICQEPKVPEEVCNKLSTVISFMGYLYVFDFCEDDDIGSWIIPAFTKNFSMEQCNELSLIIGTKINESHNNQLLKAFLAFVEYHSRENLFEIITNLKKTIFELNSKSIVGSGFC